MKPGIHERWTGLVLRTVAVLAGGLLVAGALPADGPAIIPRPAIVEAGEGGFVLRRQTPILVEAGSAPLKRAGALLRDAIRAQTGWRLALREANPATAASSRGLHLILNAPSGELGDEGYELIVAPEGVTIRADTPAGVFYGGQTLVQMLTPGLSTRLDPSAGGRAASPLAAAEAVLLPALRVVDRPRFGWRGLLLDCSRTFLSLDYLKRCVDVCAAYKLNVLQLHLTDDQGWRLEIRSHPRLTEIGSKFDARFPGEVGGYYTQKQIKELVRYAAVRHVTLVPEIEMPAHCLALLKSYPDLSCRGGADEYVIAPYLFMTDPHPEKTPATPYGVLCVGNERTFAVVADILAEVMELFPSEYIHIAGDECSKGWWQACPKCQARIRAEGLQNEDELQSYFIRRVAGMVQARGRKAVGWDEVLEGGLAPGVVLMSWRSFDAGITAARLGHPVVMASKSHVYFDYGYQRTPASLVYAFDPVPPELDTPALRPLVLGGEACMWTHLARTEAGVDMSIFPRVLALAETLWTPVARKDWEDCSRRLKLHEPILKAKGVACFEWNTGLGLPNLTCGQDGRLWLVNAAGEIFLRTADRWERFPGRARQVTSTPDGTVWAVSTTPARRGFALAKWSAADHAWQPVGKAMAAVQIAAAPDNSLWAAANDYAIFRYADGQWANVIGLAREISVGPDGTVWVLTMDPAPDGFELHAAPPGGRWRRVQPAGAGLHLAACSSGEVLVWGANGEVRLLRDGRYHKRTGKLIALTATRDGVAWALAGAADGTIVNLVQWTGSGWKTVGRAP